MTRPGPSTLSARDQALLRACEWLAAHPENVDGADRSGVLRVVRRLERSFGRLTWPSHAEVCMPYGTEPS
ncbi:MAG: hypothetical protein ACYTG2_12530 [Planctomycetota bacterium]|jgi:hypothetical protein